jgi:PKD repeat protein
MKNFRHFLCLPFLFLFAISSLNVNAQINVNLGNDTTFCSGQNLVLNPLNGIQLFEDSLVVTYQATQGQSQLQGANKVYFHSTYELIPFGGPVNPWVGNWGIDDSLGLMTEIAPDLWRITIHIRNYYNLPQGTNINGLFMVFRNEDGTATGKDQNGNDIFMLLTGAQPSSAFSGVNGFYFGDAINSVFWSTGSSDSSIVVNNSGTYWVAVTDSAGLVFRDTIVVTINPTPGVNLGTNITPCANPINQLLDAGSGFDAYLWNDGSTQSTLTATAVGNYSVQVTLGLCTAVDTITINPVQPLTPPNLGNDTAFCVAGSFQLNPGVAVSPLGDSLVIVYDATQGVTGLIASPKVYMHAGVQFIPFGPWQNVIGNWGIDDGIGEMSEIAPNLWRIVINPQTYFGLNPGQTYEGLLMVFRNADGTATGKDNNDEDIFIDLSGNISSSFAGVTPTFNNSVYTSILWSTGVGAPNISVNQSGTYWVTVSGAQGCVASDTVIVTFATTSNLNLGNDLTICNPVINVNLNAGNYDTYLWNTGATSSSINVTQSGTYSVTVSQGICISSDTIVVNQGAVTTPINLGNDTLICGLGTVVLNSGVTISSQGDSLTIVYDATQGVTGLVGANKVYMHSGVEQMPFGGWDITIGNWGQDDGIGLMDSIGVDLWKITINPWSYYGINPGLSINGLLMVFRNADGTATGKDNNDQDVFISMNNLSAVTSSFTGVTPTFTPNFYSSIQWSDGSILPTLPAASPGTYFATVTTTTGCNLIDTIVVGFGNIPLVDAGSSQNLCPGEIVTFNAGPGFSSYNWSTGATTPSITVNTAGTYTVTVTNQDGCSGIDVINLANLNLPIASFTFVQGAGGLVNFTNTSSDAVAYQWDFNGDGTNDASSMNPFYTYFSTGNFTVRLIATNECGVDTLYQTILVSSVSELSQNFALRVYPNPVKDIISIQLPAVTKREQMLLNIYDQTGKLVISDLVSPQMDKGNLVFNVSTLQTGVYHLQLQSSAGVYNSRIIKE